MLVLLSHHHKGQTKFTLRPNISRTKCILVVTQLFTSLQPYAHLPDDDLVLHQIAQGQKPVIPENAEDLAIERGLSDAVCILMESCWYDLPTDRPTCHNITRTLHAIMGKLRSKSAGE